MDRMLNLIAATVHSVKHITRMSLFHHWVLKLAYNHAHNDTDSSQI